MKIMDKVRTHGLRKSFTKAIERANRPYYLIRHRGAPLFSNPTQGELLKVEEELAGIGVEVKPLQISKIEFDSFKKEFVFPEDYLEGKSESVMKKKLLEHFIAYKLAGLEGFVPGKDTYVDVAASGSPWAMMLRDRGYKAYAIDLEVGVRYKHLDYYMQMDAKRTTFKDSSVKAVSLQCAYEMFAGEDDFLFIDECARILETGGRAIISPLYMHTHHCGYSTPEYYKKGFADKGAKQYIREDCWGVPFSRKYDALTLKNRILGRIRTRGMDFNLYKIANKEELGGGVNCHFVLEIAK